MEDFTLPECEELFNELFPDGFATAEIMATVAPDGWEKTGYAAYVPTIQQAYDAEKARKSLQHLMACITAGKMTPPEPFENFATFEENYQAPTPNPFIDLQETVGNCLWDIFSDNNDVVRQHKKYHTGSFRGSAGFIAEWLNKISEKQYDYMNFYMGNTAKADAACNFIPVYQLIFSRLKQAGCNWVFNFNELSLINLAQPKAEEAIAPQDYDPNKALEASLKAQAAEKEREELRAKLDDLNAKAKEDALYKAPPQAVQAYQLVFKKFPVGWPPI
jgi:hypothetical protein